ncbi:MAG: hypothetical protein LBE12_07500 [Planctomycetaceae bacterium]|nr:hypothetical protein [Planctomycetaceae bacterium]
MRAESGACGFLSGNTCKSHATLSTIHSQLSTTLTLLTGLRRKNKNALFAIVNLK